MSTRKLSVNEIDDAIAFMDGWRERMLQLRSQIAGGVSTPPKKYAASVAKVLANRNKTINKKKLLK